MKAFVGSVLAVCLVATSTVSAQINPLTYLLMGGEGLGDMFGMEGGSGIWMYQSLQNRINALEMQVRSGAIGGCESGVLGPFTPTQLTGTITFQRPFLGAPALSLSLSDLITANPALPINVQVRPDRITSRDAMVTLTDATGNVASMFVAYMACPSNSPYSSGSD